MPTTERLRVGIIGAGGIAQMMHLPHLRELDDRFQVVGLADVDRSRLDAVADFYGIARRFADYRELLGLDLDAVMILTSGSHAAMAVAAARAGKHVFVEKPLCYTEAELDRIGDAVAASGVRLMVGYMKRYDPAYRYGQRIIRDLADLRYVRVTVLHPASELYFQHHVFHPAAPEGALPTRELGQRMIAAMASGPEAALIQEVLGPTAPPMQQAALGIMLGSLCHDVNALRGLIGEPEAVAHTEVWNQGLCISSTLRYASGVRASLTWTYLADLRDYDEELACYSDATRVRIVFPSPFLRNYPTRVFVQGSEGLPDRAEAASWEKEVTVSYHEAFKEELLHFHDCVVNDRRPVTDLADSRADLALIHQMARAASNR
ncbi:MAG: Gfo/Idh/MocA family protein [Chloroflexota bacterium]